MQRVLLLLVLAMFSVVTALALWHHGYWGIFEPAFKSWGAAQVFMDLVIALGLIVLWMWQDAKRTGRNVWPWILLTLVLGSFGPLLYLVVGKTQDYLVAKEAV
jgi:energy-converting hydrogenase Eha subunit A